MSVLHVSIDSMCHQSLLKNKQQTDRLIISAFQSKSQARTYNDTFQIKRLHLYVVLVLLTWTKLNGSDRSYN